MTPEVFWELAAKVGLPFAMVCLALWTGKGGIWVWRREVDTLRTECDARCAELSRDRDYYRDIAFKALDRAEGAVNVADKATRLAERREP